MPRMTQALGQARAAWGGRVALSWETLLCGASHSAGPAGGNTPPGWATLAGPAALFHHKVSREVKRLSSWPFRTMRAGSRKCAQLPILESRGPICTPKLLQKTFSDFYMKCSKVFSNQKQIRAKGITKRRKGDREATAGGWSTRSPTL